MDTGHAVGSGGIHAHPDHASLGGAPGRRRGDAAGGARGRAGERPRARAGVLRGRPWPQELRAAGFRVEVLDAGRLRERTAGPRPSRACADAASTPARPDAQLGGENTALRRARRDAGGHGRPRGLVAAGDPGASLARSLRDAAARQRDRLLLAGGGRAQARLFPVAAHVRRRGRRAGARDGAPAGAARSAAQTCPSSASSGGCSRGRARTGCCAPRRCCASAGTDPHGDRRRRRVRPLARLRRLAAGARRAPGARR